MVARYRDGRLPEGCEAPAEIATEFDGFVEAVCGRLDLVDISGALEEIWRRVRRLNQWIQDQAPWTMAKDPAQAEQLDAVLYGAVEGIRSVSLMLHPFMPSATSTLLDALGESKRTIEAAAFGAAPPAGPIEAIDPLFPRIEAAPA